MLHIIGMGPGEKHWLPPIIEEVVETCDLLLGNAKYRNVFSHKPKAKYIFSGSPVQTIELLKNNIGNYREIGLLVSGDPGFFGLIPLVKEEFPDQEMTVYPGISTLQMMFARAGIPWNNAVYIDLESKNISAIPRTLFDPIAVLISEEYTAQDVAQLFIDRGMNPDISLGNSLGTAKEFFATMNAVKLIRYPKLIRDCTLIVHPNPPDNAGQPMGLRIGIPDKEFIRGEAPMTKAEIRVQILAKAQISLCDYVLDVGSGTGSISIEAAAIANQGKVFAIENNAEAQQLINANMRKFAVSNLKLVSGTAPEVFSKIPVVNVCIINGTKGRLKEVLEELPLVEGGRLVIAAISLEKVSKSLELLYTLDYEDIEVISLQAARWQVINGFHLPQSLNPVFILSAKKKTTGYTL
ncbi:precorrin-6Y C5,15-methyltransferase (decarboxylating), CbiT subunit [Syntrophobotulus glycolicus DSM 8271]|uniref:Precorrin-6Y C5,15-methyltransferase (Decarboxylating), CbiT subunit n=1 Tax=Syntrophobotulus glycolicus (strain DSM 8271 / FlGlyR) TaxID=645991 RepID=F0SZJ0_SYNGF|nr:bifunctional cobalt-precorrin-7 (C(5))-methyltransferase/cobalt-precorrin-6B (C(15))-methyltransferase [Syntrophobotulus glycolicus]ADY56076.1 precorrin-6Y C5,15-methyltransferase (decarboxylating), CbiT subunit [Syntrophobotulus glycolicus DSM 8271]